MIELQNIIMRGHDHIILDDISVKLTEQRIAIIGANGSGKSTFVRLLNGLKLPDSGKVLVDGQDTHKFGKEIRRKIGFVFQNPDNQIVMPIVEEDLAFGMKNIGIKKDEIAHNITKILAKYDLTALQKQPIQYLSGGEKQLISICSVLLMQPEVIIFDEPTTALDLRNKRKIMQTMLELSQQIIVISHDLELLHDFDRALVFDAGKIICDDRPKKAIAFYESYLA